MSHRHQADIDIMTAAAELRASHKEETKTYLRKILIDNNVSKQKHPNLSVLIIITKINMVLFL